MSNEIPASPKNINKRHNKQSTKINEKNVVKSLELNY